jgi:hypothetical protein
MTWNSTSNKFDVSVPPSYGDSNFRTVLSTSTGTGLQWNAGTNRLNVVFPPSPLPYGDTEVRTLLSTSAGTGGISWNTSTLKYDISVPASYTDTNVRTVLSSSTGTNMVWNTTTNKFDVTVTGGLKLDTTSRKSNLLCFW